MKRSICLVIIYWLFQLLHAQNSFTENRLLETKFHYGYLWPHHSSIEYSITGLVPGVEVNYLYQANSMHIWEDLYRNPRKGIGMSCFYMNDHDVFGSAIGIYGLYDIPIIKLNRFVSTYRICGGLSWLTKIWDINTNRMETAIGTHINLYFRGAITSRITLGEKTELTLDFGLTHFSNGNIKEPNLGLNLVTPSIGFIYNINSNNKTAAPDYEIPEIKKWNINFNFANGYKAINGFNNHYYYKNSIYVHTGYNISIKRQIGLGIDLFYDGAIKETSDEETEDSSDELIEAGFVAYHDLRYRKLVLTIQFGLYIYNGEIYRPIYNRNGIKYYFNKHINASVCLKSHATQADYVEWGIGYTL